jgi:hypothetical protein
MVTVNRRAVTNYRIDQQTTVGKAAERGWKRCWSPRPARVMRRPAEERGARIETTCS